MQNNRWLQALLVLLVIIASIWLAGQVWTFLIQFSNIILLFFLSWLLAFILRPIARWLTNKGVPNMMSVAIVYLGLAILFSVGGYLLIPKITEQISRLINNFDLYKNQISSLVNDLDRQLRSMGVQEVDLNQFYGGIAGQVQSAALSVLQNTFSVLQSVATIALQLILVLIFSFYFMKDGDRLFGGILQMLPPQWRDEARLVGLSIERSFGAFVRGQLMFALVYAVLTAIVMLIPPFQLYDFFVVASIVAGLCMIIPLVGNFLAFMPPMFVILVTPEKAHLWPWFLLALFIMQSLMMNVLGPRIMSSAIGIHPLYVVAAILIGGQVAGLWGALFGIPIAGAINLIGRPLMRRVRHQVPLYQEARTATVTTATYLTGPLAVHMADNAPAQPVIAEPPTQPHVAVKPDLDLEIDVEPVTPPAPTLSARVVRGVFHVGARAVSWAWTRAQARASRH